MKIGVMSDIHGNCVALDAVLEDIRSHPVDRWVCLGDVVQGGSQPVQVVERLRELRCPVIEGNTDAFIATGEVPTDERSKELDEVREWTAAQIGEEGLDYLSSLPSTYEIELDGQRSLLCFHGSPRSFHDVLLPETDVSVLRSLLGDAAMQCGGHTHLQWTTTLDGKTFFNPGSVGLAYNRHQPGATFHFSPWAEFAVVHDDRVEFCKVPFDVDALKDATLRSGHPYAERLASQY